MNKATLTHPVSLALFATLAFAAWMLSGLFDTGAREANDGNAPIVAERDLMRVEVLESQAADVTREIMIQGQMDPLREAQLKAETAGRVEAILAKKGLRVKRGEAILTLAMNDREARLLEARARLRHATARADAAARLRDKSYLDQVSLMEIETAQASARAEVEKIELEIRNTRIVAPFDGIVNDRIVEVGDYVGIGDPVATMVDDNTMLASGYLPQQSVGKISLGQTATARLFSGEEMQGKVTYISAQSANESRTFRVEVEIPNPEHELNSGISTMLSLAAGSTEAHFISPSILSLGEQEQLGVKVVADDNRVVFHPVEVVRTERNGVWVAGLPQRVTLITMGQGFVNPGEKVAPVEPGRQGSAPPTLSM
jgi:multidrug efflux system membrane fusion protein